MNRNPSLRRGEWAAVIAGIAWALSSIPALFFSIPQTGDPGSFADFYIETLHFLAEACILISLLGLRHGLSEALGKAGIAGIWVAFVGDAMLFVLTMLFVVLLFAGVVTGADYGSLIGDAIPSVLFILGLLGTLIGCIMLGIILLRKKVLAWWAGAGLIAYPILFFLALFNYGFFLLIGFSWIAVGFALRGNISASLI